MDYMHARFCSPELGRFLSVDEVKVAHFAKPQTWNRYAYARGNPVLFLDPDGREDKRSTRDVAILEDPDVLVAVAGMMRMTKYDQPLADRQEVGAVVAEPTAGDFAVEGGLVTDGSLTSVNLALGRTSQGNVVTQSGQPLGATMHTHPGTGPVTQNGRQAFLIGGGASSADRGQARITGRAVFIFNADKNLIKVEVTKGKVTTKKILTRNDYEEFLKRAKAAEAGQRALTVLRAAFGG